MGCLALAHRRRTRSSVSSPDNVVRSAQLTPRSSHAACHSFFTVRRATWVCARRSTALVLTRTCSIQSRFRGMPRFDSSERPPSVATEVSDRGAIFPGAAFFTRSSISYRCRLSSAISDSNCTAATAAHDTKRDSCCTAHCVLLSPLPTLCHPERSCHPRSERQRSRRTPCNLNPAMPFRGFSPCTQDHVRIPLHVCGGTRVTGVLRLRNCCASRSSFSAQDDSSLLLDRLSCKRHL